MVKVGVIGSGRVAKSVAAFALDDGHEVVCLAEHAQEYEYFAHENLTVIDGSCVNAPDLERVVKGGLSSLDTICDEEGNVLKAFHTEGKIRRFISTESLSTVASRYSRGSGRSRTFKSSRGSSRSTSGANTPKALSGLTPQARSGAATPKATSEPGFKVNRDKSTAANSTASTVTLINRGISSCTGMSGSNLSMCTEQDYLEVIARVQESRKEDAEVEALIEKRMHNKDPCDVVVLAVSDQRGSYKHELIMPALSVIMACEPAPKRIIVVTQNGCGSSMFTGNPLRQAVPWGQDIIAGLAKDMADNDAYLGGGVWEIPTWKDMEIADKFVRKQMKDPNCQTEFLLVRPNAFYGLARENNTIYNSKPRRDSYNASHSSGFLDNFVPGINTGDVGRFIADHLDDKKYDGKPVHLYRTYMASGKA